MAMFSDDELSTLPLHPYEWVKIWYLVPLSLDDFKHEKVTLLHLKLFLRSKGLDCVKSIGRDWDRIRIEFSQRDIHAKLGDYNTINGLEFRSMYPWEANTVFGVIQHEEIKYLTQHDLTTLLKTEDPSVAATKKLTPTSAMVYFLREELPTEVVLGWDSVPVRPYIPLPTRCYRCQAYGHQAWKCKAQEEVCSSCAGVGHSYRNCTSQTPKCAGCGGQHSANSQSCPKWMEQRQVRKITASGKFSYRDALLQVRSRSQSSAPARPKPAKHTPAHPPTPNTTTPAPATRTQPAATPQQTTQHTPTPTQSAPVSASTSPVELNRPLTRNRAAGQLNHATDQAQASATATDFIPVKRKKTRPKKKTTSTQALV